MMTRVAFGDPNRPAAVLYHADCLEILPTLDGACDIVSDPPYGIAHFKGQSGGGIPARRNSETIEGDDVPFDPVPLVRFRNVLLWGADHYRRELPAGGRWLAWDKLAGLAAYDSFSDVEFGWYSQPGKAQIFSYLWKGVVRMKAGEDETRTHPTQKPIALMKWCLGLLPRPIEAVVDPYMGSGTTGVACVQLGIPFIGVEKVAHHFETAVKRIQAAHDSPRMFSEPLAKPEQMALLEEVAP